MPVRECSAAELRERGSREELQERRDRAVARQRKRRAIARAKGMCCICCINPVTEGLNPAGKLYTTCSECRADIAPGNNERQNARRAGANAKGLCNICCVRPVTEGRTIYDEPFKSCAKCRRDEPESSGCFCVDCQAFDFHRDGCPTLAPKRMIRACK